MDERDERLITLLADALAEMESWQRSRFTKILRRELPKLIKRAARESRSNVRVLIKKVDRES